jgi:hypothetical protein
VPEILDTIQVRKEEPKVVNIIVGLSYFHSLKEVINFT